MELDEAELATFDEYHRIVNWCGIAQPVWNATKVAFGLADDTPPRTPARIPEASWKASIPQVRITGQAPNAVQTAQIGELWEVCCLAVGEKKFETMQKRDADKVLADTRTHELELAAAGVTVIGGQTLTVPAQPLQTVKPNTRMVAYESTVEIMSSNDVTAAYEDFNKTLGSGIGGAAPVMPHPDEESTIEQLTALRAVVASGTPPSVAFSVWRPLANRHKKPLAFHGLHIGVDGAIVFAVLMGPANIEEWLASWRIFKVACLMLKILSTAAADAYSGHISWLHTRYGSQVWLLLYQADIRVRSEHAERVRRKGEAIQAKAGVDPCQYDPDMTWEFVYRQATEDFAYWSREFESDALLIRAHIDNTQSLLGPDMGLLTDVTKRGGSGGGGGGSSSAQWEPPPQGERSKRAKSKKGDKQGKNGPRFDSRGNFVANHGGTPLCFAYQTGECTEITVVGNVPRCSRDTSRAHQCARCLGCVHMPTRRRCQCLCWCSHRPGRLQACLSCGQGVGPGCCLCPSGRCHVCEGANPQDRIPQSREMARLASYCRPRKPFAVIPGGKGRGKGGKKY